MLKCFIQFTCTTLDGSQKEGGNMPFLTFLTYFRKRGFRSEKGGSNTGGNYAYGQLKLSSKDLQLQGSCNVFIILRKILTLLIKNGSRWMLGIMSVDDSYNLLPESSSAKMSSMTCLVLSNMYQKQRPFCK